MEKGERPLEKLARSLMGEEATQDQIELAVVNLRGYVEELRRIYDRLEREGKFPLNRATIDEPPSVHTINPMSSKPITPYQSFEALDCRIGKIIKVEDAETKKPTYRMTIDFGPDVGIKRSCGAYRNYSKEELLGKLVIGVINFEPKKMGPEISEVLVLGVQNEKGETIYLTPQSPVTLGVQVF